MKIKKWKMTVNSRHISIIQLPDSTYLATDYDCTIPSMMPSSYADIREEVFKTIEDACIFLGYPIGILPTPELK